MRDSTVLDPSGSENEADYIQTEITDEEVAYSAHAGIDNNENIRPNRRSVLNRKTLE